MRILITGHTGFIGRALADALRADGHIVHGVSRSPSGPNHFRWDPTTGRFETEGLEGLDAAVHLAGESVSEGRWTPEKKAAIRNSRTEGTALLARTLARLERKPAVLLSASAVGYYGPTGDRAVTEDSPPGSDFLAQVAREWEAATSPAEDAGIRVCHMRLGIVLHPEGGFLGRALPLFRLGLGGPLGSGRQWMSWITRPDVVRAIRFLMDRDELSGPFNMVTRHPATNAEMTRALAAELRRPAFLRVPAFALRVLFGEMADAVILQDTRVLPERLEKAGFAWLHPALDTALPAMLRPAKD